MTQFEQFIFDLEREIRSGAQGGQALKTVVTDYANQIRKRNRDRDVGRDIALTENRDRYTRANIWKP